MLLHQEDGEEDNTFRQGRTDDGLGQDLTRCTRITADCFCSLHADDTDADGGADRGQANVQTTTDFCEHHMFTFLFVVHPPRQSVHRLTGKIFQRLMVRFFSAFVAMRVFITMLTHEAGEDGREQHEHERLHQADDQFHKIER